MPIFLEYPIQTHIVSALVEFGHGDIRISNTAIGVIISTSDTKKEINEDDNEHEKILADAGVIPILLHFTDSRSIDVLIDVLQNHKKSLDKTT